MGAQAPQWLLTSFVDAMQQIGATATETDLEHEGADLMQRWNAPNRQLHNVRRLMNTLTHIDEIASSAHDPDILRVAAWYHGAFLNKALEIKLGGFQANFAATRCIDHAHNRLTNLGVADEVVARIDELIAFLTRHRAPRSDFDAQVLVDADLAGLACSPQDYKKLRTSLRAELSELDDLQFVKARLALVKKLLSYETIYQSPLGSAWENTARANLEVELTRLDRERAQLCAATPTEDADDSDDSDDVEEVEDDSVTSTGTLIIKRRSIKKRIPVVSPDNEVTSTGVLPRKIEDLHDTDEDEEATSSLESAVESLDLPNAD
ncbi:hypothetical protein O3669_07215 [Pauljensenia sp. 20925_1_34]|uniref:HD domain-containing protein n=1 Tax=Pauljensenia sp. 20925_1_34 TaxID=3003674 RepID=UPI00352E5397